MLLLTTILAFFLIVTVLVAAHEYGHYLFARIFKMGVEEFAIGFGRPYWVWRRKAYDTPNGPEETEFTLRPLPLGGFVRIKGMISETENPLDDSTSNIPGGFYSKSPFARFMVLFAGPLFSVIAGIAILVPMYMAQGLPQRSTKPIIGSLGEGGPAASAGLKIGDLVLSIDGQPIKRFSDLVFTVRDRANQPLAFAVERDGKVINTVITPILGPDPTPVLDEHLEETGVLKKQGRILAGPEEERVPATFGQALGRAVSAPIEMIKSLFGIATGQRKASEEVGGPITMFKATQKTVEIGVTKVIELGALLSISIGIFNLLPIHPLDGGQMLVAFLEMLRKGKRLSLKARESISKVGLAMLALIFFGVFYVDIVRWIIPEKKPVPVAEQR